MNEELIQSLNAYTNALEQRLSALEQRVTLLENRLSANSQTDQSVAGVLEQMQQQIALIQATNNTIEENIQLIQDLSKAVETVKNEPEVEVELIVGEDEDAEAEPAATTLVEEDIEEETTPEAEDMPEVHEEAAQPQEEVREEAAASAETESAPAAEPQKKVEEEVVQPHAEDPKPAAEAHQETKTEVKTAPTQTSLFGSPVKDIRQAISLGDRFLFQRELFAGNGEKMQRALDELNALDTLDEALEYVREHFDWDKESTAAQLFENVLRRRF